MSPIPTRQPSSTRIVVITAYLQEPSKPQSWHSTSTRSELHIKFEATGGLVESELAAIYEAVRCVLVGPAMGYTGYDWLGPDHLSYAGLPESCHTTVPKKVVKQLRRLVRVAGLEFKVQLHGVEVAALHAIKGRPGRSTYGITPP